MPSPLATYRLQLCPRFGFAVAAELADYLRRLGVTHLYASPYLQAAPGSLHGYDVVDPTRVNEELGGPDGHRRLCDALGAAGLGQVLDIVPNHLWVDGAHNPWWWDVLTKGPSSPHADTFDIDWEAPAGVSPSRVMLPLLGAPLPEVLDAGELALASLAVAGDDLLVVRYYEHAFPVASGSLESAGLAGPPDETPAEAAARLAGDRAALEALLERQHYRLSHWRLASHEINYRRFFHINQLAGVRVELPHVFSATHCRVLEWLEQGVLDGLRIDHIDGLRDPAGYLERLRHAAPNAWLVVEKILEPGEELRRDWPVAGTTGYELAWRLLGVFVDARHEEAFEQLYRELADGPPSWPDAVYDAKHLIVSGPLAADMERLVGLFAQICEELGRSEPWSWLRDTLREVVAAFPVYRTYLRSPGEPPSPDDLEAIDKALGTALERRRHLAELIDVLGQVLRLELRTHLSHELVMRFQQVTGPAMAKGAEDTAAYRYVRLVALNEVGGDPGHFGLSVDELHALNARAADHWPAAMLATSTHDTKRSEDVRARLALLSELPEAWGDAVRRFKEHNARHRDGDRPAPCAEYLLYQTLVGAWPLEEDRAVAYMDKAIREEKRYTSWMEPDEDYEEAVRRFVVAVSRDASFQRALTAFVEPLLEPGRVNALSQALLKLTSPGVPDVYQGCELWDLSLVDPDNRRDVDFEHRRRLLDELERGLDVDAIWARADEGLPKLWLTRQALCLRRERPDVLGPGASYQPLGPTGRRAEHVVAFLRGGVATTGVPRLVMGLGGVRARWDWGDTALELPAGRWENVLDGATHRGGRLPVAELLARFPVALLTRR
jgi:(1->4)-alpha-D-glucan 1-alpha-D-glucosylmutase